MMESRITANFTFVKQAILLKGKQKVQVDEAEENSRTSSFVQMMKSSCGPDNLTHHINRKSAKHDRYLRQRHIKSFLCHTQSQQPLVDSFPSTSKDCNG